MVDEHFYKILSVNKMSSEWRISALMLIVRTSCLRSTVEAVWTGPMAQ